MSTAESARDELIRLAEHASPFNRLLGIRCEAAEAGRVTLSLQVRDEFIGDPRRPALHGGVLCSLIDAAGGLAAWSLLGRDEAASTIDLRVDFLEPAEPRGELHAAARVVRKGGRTCWIQIEARQDATLVALGHGVYRIHGTRD
jgi:uncharacterized protein (TIGR00369 family)